MKHKHLKMAPRKKIALVAHDHKKDDLLEWSKFNIETLRQHELFATGTTGWLLHEQLGLEIHQLQSGPLGGDQQMGQRLPKGRLIV